MMVESERLISVASVAPGDALYVVVLPFDHPTLRVGDVVKMVQLRTDNIFIRVSDLTAHSLQSGHYYVMVVPKE